MRFPIALVVAVVVVACATPPPKPPRPTPKKEAPAPDHPATWADVTTFYGSKCPGPIFTLDTPLKKTIGGVPWTVSGSTATRGEPWSGPVIIGVLGAIKDATDDTKQNLQKAKAAFDKAGVNVVLTNGDLAEQAEIHEVAVMLGDIFGDDRPLLVHPGNSEPVGSFLDAFGDEEKKHPAILDMNFIRDVDLGGVHILSLPGWSVRKFVKPGGCFYKAEDVDVVRGLVDGINKKGELAILTAHGPPRGVDKKSLDATNDFGNVGDTDLAALLQEGNLRFGIFGHILEAGGRATDDPAKHKLLALPMKKPTKSLFVNVGSASSFGIAMIDGKKTSRGMAAIVTIDNVEGGGEAKVQFISLRK